MGLILRGAACSWMPVLSSPAAWRAHLRLLPLGLCFHLKAFYFCPIALAAAAISMGTLLKSAATHLLGSPRLSLPHALHFRPGATQV